MKKRKIKGLLNVLLLGLIGAILGYFLGNYLFAVQGNIELPFFYYTLMIFLLIIAAFSSIAVHEAGHLLAGKWLKFEFHMFVVGPFLWVRENNRIIFKWNKNLNVFGGLTYCIPKNDAQLRKKFILYVAGGPIASLLFAGIMYWLMHVTSPLAINNLYELFIQDFFKFHAFISIMIFLAAIIPIRSGGFKSDGGRLITLARNNDKARIELFLIITHAYLNAGTRPAELNLTEIEQYLAGNQNDHYTINCHYYLYLAYFDRKEYPKAEEHLLVISENIEVYPTALHSNIWLEIIFLQAFIGNDLEMADGLWKNVTRSAFTPKTDLSKAEAALSLLKKDFADTTAKIKEARFHLDKIQEKGMQLALNDWLNRLADKTAENQIMITP